MEVHWQHYFLLASRWTKKQEKIFKPISEMFWAKAAKKIEAQYDFLFISIYSSDYVEKSGQIRFYSTLLLLFIISKNSKKDEYLNWKEDLLICLRSYILELSKWYLYKELFFLYIFSKNVQRETEKCIFTEKESRKSKSSLEIKT